MIPVRFDQRTWGRLASMADMQGITIGELLERAAERLVTGTSHAPKTRGAQLKQTRAAHRQALVSVVLRLRAQGNTVAAIADIIGYSKSYVSRILCENGHRTWQRSDAGQETSEGAERRAK